MGLLFGSRRQGPGVGLALADHDELVLEVPRIASNRLRDSCAAA
jgi:hypothetical protein